MEVRHRRRERRKMSEIDLKEMLEAGVHFGHKKDRWNPKMKPFIFAERNGVHIFDLVKTKEKLEEAVKFTGKVASEGGVVLFVGTKNQIKGIIKTTAENAGMPYIAERWPGGMFTNFATILTRLKFLRDAEEKKSSGAMTKKEALTLRRELEKLNETFEGVKDMKKLPDAIFVVDIVKERNAIKEAKKLGIPVIGIADSNANPDIEYPIPGNDDAVRAVKYITEKIAEAIEAHKKDQKEAAKKEEAPAKTEETVVTEEGDDNLDKIEMEAAEKVVVKRSRPKDEAVTQKEAK